MKFKNIIFDLDGTITDSQEGIIKTIKYSLDKVNIDYSKANLISFIGPPLKDSYMNIFSMTEKEALKAIDYYQERFDKQGKFENYVYNGIEDLLKKLKEKNLNLYVATTKPEIFAIQILEHFNLLKYFDIVSGGSLDQKLADKSEIIKIVLDKANITDKSSVIMVGDRFHDIVGAKKNNIYSAGVLYGYGSYDELKKENPDYIAQNIKELLFLLTK